MSSRPLLSVRRAGWLTLIALWALASCAPGNNDASPGGSAPADFTSLEGPYLGQQPPDNTPEVFAPGILSTRLGVGTLRFTGEGDQLFFVGQQDDPAGQLPEHPFTWSGFRRYLDSSRNGSTNYYWLDAGIIEELRPR